MILRRKKFVLLTLFVLIGTLYFTTICSAGLLKPEMAVGDYWNYTGNYMGTTATETVIISERTNITVDNVAYDVFVSVGVIDGKGAYNTSINRTQTVYFRVSDNAIVKLTDYFNYSSDSLNQTIASEYVYSLPLIMMHYPINVGDTWDNQYVIKTTDLLTTNVSEQQMNESYECEQTTAEFEMGKTFQCYAIKKTEYIQSERYTTRYYLSSEVGSNPVKMVVEYNDHNIVSLRLASTSYIVDQKDTENDNSRTPGFELILIVCGMALILFFKRKKM